MQTIDKLGLTFLIIVMLCGWGWFGYYNEIFKNKPYPYKTECIEGFKMVIGHSGGIAGPIGECNDE